jgi:outer membrane protein assembly factor BamE
MRSHRIAALALALAMVQGCSWAPSWGVYKLEIVQGNYVTQDMVERLKVGMNRSQVRTALGTPLVTDAFHGDRWDYVYELRRQGQLVEHHELRVFFENDKLVRWEGGELPQSPLALRRAAGEASMPGVPPGQPPEKGWWDQIREKMGW